MISTQLKRFVVFIFLMCGLVFAASVELVESTQFDSPGELVSSCLSHDGNTCFSLVKLQNGFILEKRCTQTGKLFVEVPVTIDLSTFESMRAIPLDSRLTTERPTPLLRNNFGEIEQVNFDACFKIKPSKQGNFICLKNYNSINILRSLDLSQALNDIMPIPVGQISTFELDEESGLLACGCNNGTVVVFDLIGNKGLSSGIFTFTLGQEQVARIRSLKFENNNTIFVESLGCIYSININNGTVALVKIVPKGESFTGFDCSDCGTLVTATSDFKSWDSVRRGYPVHSCFFNKNLSEAENTKTMFYSTVSSVNICSSGTHVKISGSKLRGALLCNHECIINCEDISKQVTIALSNELSLIKSVLYENILTLLIKRKLDNRKAFIRVKINNFDGSETNFIYWPKNLSQPSFSIIKNQ